MKYTDAPTLADFLQSNGDGLDTAARAAIVEQAIVLLDQVYAHLPLKAAMLGIDPVQRLRLLRNRVHTFGEDRFHAELIAIFTALRDQHTAYLLPEPYADKSAFLPFLVESYLDDGRRRYLVTRVADGLDDPSFRPGVEPTHWNGVPMDRAVARNAETQPGGNEAARFARGLSALTVRSLRGSLAPDEDWVIVSYRDAQGRAREIRFEWRVSSDQGAIFGDRAGDGVDAVASGIDGLVESTRRVRKELFAPAAMAAEHDMAALWAGRGEGAPAGAPEAKAGASVLPDNFTFRVVETPHGPFAYLRLWSFSEDARPFPSIIGFIDAYVRELIRLLEQAPDTGLILDARGNPGGHIPAGERILELFTPREIEPARFHFRNTPLIRDLCRLAPRAVAIGDAEATIVRGMETGAAYSEGCALMPFAREYNRIGQRYHGPVVLVTDALSYSTTDIFAAGFQDNRVGPVLGTDGRTGAGGANAWSHATLARFLRDAPSWGLAALPGRASFSVAVRRTTRVGSRAGVPLEDLGVTPDHDHAITKRDVLGNNDDLILRAASILAALPKRRLSVSLAPRVGAEGHRAVVRARGATRLDVYVDDRPEASVDVAGEETTIDLARARPGAAVEVRGFDGRALVARLRTEVPPTSGSAPS